MATQPRDHCLPCDLATDGNNLYTQRIKAANDGTISAQFFWQDSLNEGQKLLHVFRHYVCIPLVFLKIILDAKFVI